MKRKKGFDFWVIASFAILALYLLFMVYPLFKIMGKSKDKRIRKLKKTHIWPSILGLFLISGFLGLVMLMVVSFLLTDMAKNKIVAGCQNTESLVYLLEQVESPEDIKEIEESLLIYIDMESDVEDIAILKDDTVLWSGNGKYPSLDSESQFFFEDIRVYIENDPNNTFKVEADDIIINGERINVKTVLDILHEEIRLVETEEFGHLKVWFEVPSTIGNAYVLTNLKFYSYDLLALVVCCSLIVLIIIVFVIYYLISFMHLLHTTRKTTKVIYTDMVTGGANQLFFEKRGNALIKRAARRGRKYAVVHLKMRKYRSYCTCFGVKEGEFLAIVGPSGGGKSTLFSCMLGMKKPRQGTVQIQGRDIGSMTEREIATVVGFVPQSHNPAFSYTVEEFVLMGCAAKIGLLSSPGAKEREKTRAALEKMGISHLAGTDP